MEVVREEAVSEYHVGCAVEGTGKVRTETTAKRCWRVGGRKRRSGMAITMVFLCIR